MDLVFSWFADAGAWPEHPGSGIAVLDQAVVGPLRLLDHVETMLGLGGPQVSSVERIAAYRQKLEAAGSGMFWSRSFALDPWSSTRELLGWRDELIEAGWRPGVGETRTRFSHLSTAEQAGPQLPTGNADRLCAVIDGLVERPKIRLRSIKLVDERALFPVGWRILLDHLEQCGVGIEQLPPAPAPALDDGRLSFLAADTELVAAEALAAWLAAAPEENGDLVFVLGKDTGLLDHSLHKAGMPRLGYSAPSPYRALLQLLSLSFTLAWNPPDPGRLLDFLLLPIGPLPRSFANRLAGVVANSPGIGGEEWNEAWVEIEKELKDAEGADPRKVAARLGEWREFVEPERHDTTQGMPRAAARRIAEKVSAWAVKRAGASDDPLFLSLAQIAANLATAIAATETERLDRVLVERMLEEAVGVGVADPSAITEAAPWRSLRHPGAIWGETGTVIWWHFADNGETGSRMIWNELERAALAEAGCLLDEPDLVLQRLSAAWERPLRFAKRIIFVRSAVVAGAETAAHPLWHSLVAQRDSLETEATVRAEVVLSAAETKLLGRKLIRKQLALVPPPEQRAQWTAPEAAIRPRPAESATSLAALLSCPLQWTLRYAGKLYPSARQSLPNIDNLVGTLAHRIAQDIFHPGPAPEPELVEREATARLTELLPQMAATLLLPGAAGELAAAKVAVPQALADLARFLRSKKLTVVAVEHQFSVAGALDADTEVRGFIDLLAKLPSGRLVVVDLKWQRRESRRRAELENGLALQLAVYARQISDENVGVETGYFMLRQRRFLTTGSLGGAATLLIDGPTPKETWDRISTSWKATMTEISSGSVQSPFEQADTSIKNFVDAHLLMPPSCGFCDYAGLCGVAS